MCSFGGTKTNFIEDFQISILSMVLYVFLTLKFASMRFDVFQFTNYCETNFLSKKQHFQSSSNYIEMRVSTSFSEQLVEWSGYFFLIY